jgi:4-hydroxy-3-methylbut-2-en-1-yl diphosphate reductase
MQTTIDTGAGFCFGVTRVVEKAEEIIRQHGRLYCLGEIVHNRKEIERLEGMGLKTITHEEYLALSDCRVLIRAHGEPPETYAHAASHNIDLIDGTCPIVLRLQSRIKSDYTSNSPAGTQIVIFGKKDHAEVRGLAGQTDYRTIIVESDEDLAKIDFAKPVHLYAQTTMSPEKYTRLKSGMMHQAKSAGMEPETFKCTNSICGQVSGRVPRLKQFCRNHDLILFVSYKQSSNGKLLFAECKEVNPNTHFVSETADINPAWFEHAGKVGITGATSTPRWLLEEFEEFVKGI